TNNHFVQSLSLGIPVKRISVLCFEYFASFLNENQQPFCAILSFSLRIPVKRISVLCFECFASFLDGEILTVLNLIYFNIKIFVNKLKTYKFLLIIKIPY
ncbi:hypothetical protein Avbf_14723, partial [Armadillidium vulgare]